MSDLVYRRYGGGAGDVLSMPFRDGCELVEYALDAECEDRIFLRWAMMYQDKMGYEEFKGTLCRTDSGAEESPGAEEILKKVIGILG